MGTNGLVDEWEVWQYAARLSEVTITERVRVLKQLANESECNLLTIRSLDIVRWYASHSGDWSDSTHSTYHSYLSTFFRWLQLQEHRLDNPLLKVGSPKAPERVARPVADAAMLTILKSNMHHRTRVMILLAGLGGLRCSEIARFKGEHVDLERGRFVVLGKGKTVKYVPLHPILATTAESMPTRGYWFPSNSSRPGQCVRGKSVSDMIATAIRRTGVDATAHQLRHWYGTTLLEDGADIRVVQELLRHASLISTQIYTKATDVRMHAAIRALDPYRSVA